MGDFEVAIGGGFWVAVSGGITSIIRVLLIPLGDVVLAGSDHGKLL